MDHSEHVLIVDDDQGICEVLREYLETEGYRVSVAHNGSEMQRLMAEAPINLVLLDLVLPGEDGLCAGEGAAHSEQEHRHYHGERSRRDIRPDCRDRTRRG